MNIVFLICWIFCWITLFFKIRICLQLHGVLDAVDWDEWKYMILFEICYDIIIKIVFCTYIGKALSSLKMISSWEVHWGDNRSFVKKISNRVCLRFLCLEIFVSDSIWWKCINSDFWLRHSMNIHKLSLVLLMVTLVLGLSYHHHCLSFATVLS